MKKYIYIFSWIVLGILLSFLAHAGFEIGLIKYAFSEGIILQNYTVFGMGFGYCALPVWDQDAILAFGLVTGYFAGQYFWQILYVEHRYGRIPRH